MISISKYIADKETYARVIKVLESGRLSQGPQVEELEELIANISNCKYCVALSNGSVAIEAILKSVTSPLSRRIVTTPLTFRATIKAIEHSDCYPIYVDVNEDTLSIDTEPIIDYDFYMPVDLYGLKAVASGPKTIRDCAQGIGLDLSESLASSISLYTGKTIGCGEGGAVVTNDENIAENIRLLRNQGMSSGYKYELEDGYNWRMSELQAAVAIPQLKNMQEILDKRRENAEMYSAAFRNIDGLKLPYEHGENTWHIYTLRHSKRNDIVNKLIEKGIEARIYYPQLVSPSGSWIKTPNALQATKEIFSIPVHHHLTEQEREYIMASLYEVLRSV